MARGHLLSSDEKAHHEGGLSTRAITRQIGRSLGPSKDFWRALVSLDITPTADTHASLKSSEKMREHQQASNGEGATNHRSSQKGSTRIAKMNLGRDWAKVVFSDEKKFSSVGPDGNKYYCCDLRKEPVYFSRRNFGGGRLCMDSKDYQSVLEHHLVPFLSHRRHLNYVFQRDNASIHMSRAMNEWLQHQNINVVPWPACSPDLNPMEHIWSIMLRQVYADNPQFQGTEELKRAVIEAWRAIDEEHLQNIVSSMPHMLFDVTLKQEGAIDY
uniref:DDE_3 domain-containing protein n=1 Tax=Haemonchus contortus TaxID=6289 RepID=A0A7I4Z0G3_HAECO